MLRPVLLAAFTLVFPSALRDLNTPLFIGGGSSDTLTISVVIFNLWSETRRARRTAHDHPAADHAADLHSIVALFFQHPARSLNTAVFRRVAGT
ncbi:MAG: hypothetical protein R3E68_13140 [Burkholderiaceae bacterium]